MKKLLVLVLLATSLTAAAKDHLLSIKIKSCGDLDGQPAPFDHLCDDLAAEVEKELNKDQPDVNLSKYANGMAQANNMAPKGLASDYANDFDLFLVGAGAGVGLQAPSLSAEADDIEGFAANAPVLMLGAPMKLLPVKQLGPIEMNKLDVFFSFSSYSINKSQDETDASYKMSSIGAHARYLLVEPKSVLPANMLKWGGVYVHTGVQMAKNNLHVVNKPDDTEAELGNGAGTANIENIKATFDINSTSTSIPIELSSYVRFLYVFTLYGGLGMDFNSGNSKVKLKANADINGEGNADGFEAQLKAGDGLSETGTVKASQLRTFAGLQINIPFVRLYAQMQKAGQTTGAEFGIKVLY